MKWANLVRCWARRGMRAGVFGAVLLGCAHVVFAQAPAAPATQVAKAHYTKSRTFDLPVQMKPEARQTVNEIRLYVRTPTSAWKLQEAGPSHLTRFLCLVPQDGEYWYILATVDRSGRMNPEDLNRETPSQRVIVDTTPPVIQVQPSNTVAGDYAFCCSVFDANSDAASLRAVCRTDKGDVPLELVPNQPGVFRMGGKEQMRFPVLVSVRDVAGNVATKEVDLRQLLGVAAPSARPAIDIAQTSVFPDMKNSVPPPAPPVQLPAPRTETLPSPTKDDSARPDPDTRLEIPQPQGPLPLANFPMPGVGVPRPPIPQPPIIQQGGVPHQLINTPRASIAYRIDQIGASGVGKVEIYMTHDQGQSWHRLGEDIDKQSPALVNLPGDGTFGIRIVVTNGNGFGGKAPMRGDAPHCTVEVDTTRPYVQLRSVDVMPASGHVELRWNASDNNLGTAPVSLHYRTRPDGPWQVIAQKVKNDGAYRWAIPRDAGGQFFFKIEVADRAGNIAQDTSRQPVVIDMTEPRATVVGVTGGAATPALRIEQ